MSNNIDLEQSLKNDEVAHEEILKATPERHAVKRVLTNKAAESITSSAKEEIASMLQAKEHEETDESNIPDNISEEIEGNNEVKTSPKEVSSPTVNAVKTSFNNKTEEYDISDLAEDLEDTESDILNKLENGEEVVLPKSDFSSSVTPATETPVDSEEVKTLSEIDNMDNIDFNADNAIIKKNDDVLVEDDNGIDETKYIYRHFNNQTVVGRSINTKLNLIDKISVDLNNVTITKSNPIQQANEIKALFDTNVPTFMVVCCQSGYTANLTGLTLSEKNAIANSEGTIYDSRNRLYRTVYNKIHSMSIPKPDYNNWLKITSYNDLSTLLFGIYCQTFIDNNDFEITCGKCGKTTSVTVNNNSLVEVKDREVYEKRDEIISGAKTGEDLVKISLVHKNQRIMLNDCKVIIDICTPSLYDHLSLLRMVKPEVLERYADTLSVMLFISNMYMINLEETYKTGQASYYPLEKKSDILNILLKLSNSDGEQLEGAIEEKIGKLRIDYQIHNVTCAHCHSKLPGIPVDIENILFTRLNRTKTAS